MTDLVQRLKSGYTGFATPVNDMCNAAADRIEKLERENEANERNLCQLTDELAASRRENAELRKLSMTVSFNNEYIK